VFPGSTLSDHCIRYQAIPQVKMIVVLGELGGTDEYSLVEALKAGAVTKPVVAWVSGTCAKLFKSEVQFGHAGAKSGGALESAQVRIACMAAKQGPNVLFCIPNRTKCILLVSVMAREVPGVPTITEMRILSVAAK
jgi:succinyl-CoA synthetase alpha subunit